MKIESVRFVASMVHGPEAGAALPEVALSGRSNVGKSSLLNSLVGRRALAKVSGTPGKTQTLNYYLVNERFHLVDLPGYGFAKAPAAARNRWSAMMQEYLRTRRELAGVVQLVDSRHEPSREDREMVRWLVAERLPFVLVGTKTDKLAPTKRLPAVQGIARALELPASQPLVAHSSETGEGRRELLAWIAQAVEAVRGR